MTRKAPARLRALSRVTGAAGSGASNLAAFPSENSTGRAGWPESAAARRAHRYYFLRGSSAGFT
jgi:hypothetical protein